MNSMSDENDDFDQTYCVKYRPGLGRRAFMRALGSGGLALAALGLGAEVAPQLGPDYVVLSDPVDGLIKAKNGMTGVIDFSGTDASTVLQNAIDDTEKPGSNLATTC